MKLDIIIVVLLFFIGLCLINTIFGIKRKNTIKESYVNSTKNNKNLFKKNIDLNNITNRIGNNLSEKDNIKTRRLAPIQDNKFLKNVDLVNTNINGNYVAPKKRKIVKKDNSYDNLCKFISTQDNKVCNKEYPIFTGAKFSTGQNNISCNDTKITIHKASGIASIKNSFVDNIEITNKGKNYKTKPIVKIIGGGGKGAKAEAIIKNGSVIKISILDKGSGYVSTPKVLISKPKSILNCNLCCKRQL
tara:strand:+ start:161 stop:898 length:738 start_codon:yes stop_codon:yes gene_type:complete